jgi:hypothetical protein
MTIPKKHHYLPQCYLEGFRIAPQSSKVPHIWMIPKASQPKPVSPSIIDTGCEKGYHDDDTDPNNKDRSTIERGFSKIEGAHAKTITDVVANKRVSAEHKESLALFVSIMRCRVPSYKKHIEKVLQDLVSSTTRIELRSGRLPPPPPQVADLIKERGDDIFSITISNWMLMLQMINAGMRSDAPAILERMHFSLVEAGGDIGFITGDSPVSHYVPDYEIGRPYGVGLADKEIEVSIPLNDRFLLLLSWHAMPDYQVITDDHVRDFNRRTIISADRFVYASRIYDGLVKEISNLHESFSGFESQSLDYGHGFCHVTRFIPVSGKR